MNTLQGIKRMDTVSNMALSLREESSTRTPLRKRNNVNSNSTTVIDDFGRIVRGTKYVTLATSRTIGGRLFTLHLLYFSLFYDRFFPIGKIATKQEMITLDASMTSRTSDVVTCKARRKRLSFKYSTDISVLRDMWTLKWVSMRQYSGFKRRSKRCI